MGWGGVENTQINNNNNQKDITGCCSVHMTILCRKGPQRGDKGKKRKRKGRERCVKFKSATCYAVREMPATQ